MPTRPLPPRRRSRALASAALAAFLLLFVSMFEWTIVNAVTPFIALPLFGLAWLMIIVMTLWSLGYAYRCRIEGRSALAPLTICLGAILAAIYIPFTRLWLYANFHLKEEARTLVVAKIRAGELLPNVARNSKIIVLPGSGVSDGDAIVVEGRQDNPYVFFFTYRGILDNYSGFLWVPNGGSPTGFSDANDAGTEIVPYGGHWYFLAHR